ncbi:MAG: hypothetical protein OK455_10845 [Thaumarchaeota archaeon]|nr:hypothetical protein [Nitrososphaerota archaeon]
MNTRRHQGALIGIGAGLMLVILLVSQSFVGIGLLSTRTVTIVATSSVTLATTTATITVVIAGNQTYDVVKSNITSPGHAGAIAICEGFGFPCPSGDYPQPATSLVFYKGTFYYVSNIPVSTGSHGDGPIVNYDVWYTNSTVLCMTPRVASYAICP